MSDEKRCNNCRHVDPADAVLCIHPTKQCGGFMWSAFQWEDTPSCFDDDIDAPRGWEPKP